MGMVGTWYMCRGELVRVVVKWRHGKGVKRNVLCKRVDGSLFVRPFRGLKRVSDEEYI